MHHHDAAAARAQPRETVQRSVSTPRRGATRSALRGLSFADGEAMLTPSDAVVQRRDDPARGEGGLLSQEAVATALEYNRKRELAKDRPKLCAVQAVLGAPTTGVMDEGTVEGAATFQEAHGLDVDGKIGKATERALLPELEIASPAGDQAAASEEAASAAPDQAAASEEAPTAAATTSDRAATATSGHDEPLADWQTTPPATVAVSGDGPLSNEEVLEAIDEIAEMDERLDPNWVEACQRALGVAETGGYHRAFIQAVAGVQVDHGKKPTGRLDKKDVRKLLEASFPQLADLPQLFKPTEQAEKTKAGSSDAPAWLEEGVAASGLAKSWSEFRGQFQKTELCGQTVKGHPLMITRIQAAEAYLEKKFGLTGSALGKAVGCTAISDFREPKRPGYHPTGFAFDINAADNPWILTQDGRDEGNQRTADVLERATTFMGYGTALEGKDLKKLREQMTTDELYAHLQASNVALRNYRMLAGDEAAIRAQWDMGTADVKAHDVAWWTKRIADDDALLVYQGKDDRTDSNWDHKDASNKGFMTMREELVIALRDVAGLAWGGCDMGGDSGDMMHFDGRTIGDAEKLVKASKKAKESGS